MTNQIAKREPSAAQVGTETAFDRMGLEPGNFGEAFELARLTAASGLTSFPNPESAMMVLMAGRELGLGAMQAQQMFCVLDVGGRKQLRMWTKSMVALVRSHPSVEFFTLTEDPTAPGADATFAVWKAKRRGDDRVVEGSYTLAEAKVRGLVPRWEKNRQPPAGMLVWRAAQRLIDREFTEIVSGMAGSEEDAIEVVAASEVVEVPQVRQLVADSMAKAKGEGEVVPLPAPKPAAAPPKDPDPPPAEEPPAPAEPDLPPAAESNPDSPHDHGGDYLDAVRQAYDGIVEVLEGDVETADRAWVKVLPAVRADRISREQVTGVLAKAKSLTKKCSKVTQLRHLQRDLRELDVPQDRWPQPSSADWRPETGTLAQLDGMIGGHERLLASAKKDG